MHSCRLDSTRAKAKAIQTASKIILEKFGGNLNPILSLPIEEARKTLMEMPGVGPKTADVVLLFSANKPTIPVDTHVNRVSKRLGLAPAKGDYEAVRLSLQSLFQPKDYASVHLLLIAHGRKTCKAQKPQCQTCPVNSFAHPTEAYNEQASGKVTPRSPGVLPLQQRTTPPRRIHNNRQPSRKRPQIRPHRRQQRLRQNHLRTLRMFCQLR